MAEPSGVNCGSTYVFLKCETVLCCDHGHFPFILGVYSAVPPPNSVPKPAAPATKKTQDSSSSDTSDDSSDEEEQKAPGKGSRLIKFPLSNTFEC